MDLKEQLTGILPCERVLTREIDRVAFANDASVYRLVPRAVVRPRSMDDVRALLRAARDRGVSLTFRAAGTSLSGQAVTDGILVDLARDWRDVEVLDGGRRVRVQPGVIGGAVNALLRPHDRKIGPDPASIAACMMGGILANNSSGMCCGVVDNAYHTLESMVFILPGGVGVDSSEPDAEERFVGEAPEIARGLLRLRDRVRADASLVERIRRKYRQKNTMGYSINAFLDHETPVAILSHLMIGSEGTLGFIAEAVLRTVPDPPHRHTGLLFFPDVPAACSAIEPLRSSGAATLELMDRASLRAVQGQPGVPETIGNLSATAAALLVEYQGKNPGELRALRGECETLLPALPRVADPIFTDDAERQAALWSVRRGLIPSVGAVRARGTSMIIEDVVFPVELLADGVRDLQSLCTRYRYDDAIVFGHAKDGNLHFVLNQGFGVSSEIERYDRFMRELAVTVAGRYGGALKAEHGTGRNMAPFLETEWGRDACEIMRELKELIDPGAVLNPGVVLNENPAAHVTDLKSLPTVEAEVDGCIECGFCERMCPSRDLTLTPRQRIVVRREVARLRHSGADPDRLRGLESDYRHAGLDTCAVDGLCATACPVGIDTGRLVKRLRGERAPAWKHRVAALAADRFDLVESGARLVLRLGQALGKDWPPPARGPLPIAGRREAVAIYLPSCVTRVVGPGEDRSLAEIVCEVAARAGSPVRIPEGVRGHCCGLPFSSKGYGEAYRRALNRTVRSAWEWTGEGRLPLVLDTSPCAHTLKTCREDLTPDNRERWDAVRFLDGIEFALEFVLPNRAPGLTADRVILHPVCSAVKGGLVPAMVRIARQCAREVHVPPSAGCCGFAGDRGYRVPSLTAFATVAEAREVALLPSDGYYSSSRTCEIGLRRATGEPYRSFWYLLDESIR